MNIILIVLFIFVIKVVLTKIISLLGILLSFSIKGKKINYDSNKWNKFLSSLSDNFVIKYFLIIYLISSIISCIICYLIILLFNIEYKEIIIIGIFVITLIYTIIKFKIKVKEYIIIKNKEVKEFLKQD